MVELCDYVLSSPKILIMGREGTGKTLLACTPGDKVTFLDMNNGLASARLFQDKFTAARQHVDVVKCWSDKPGVAWKTFTKKLQEYVKSPLRPILVIDGLTDLAEASLGSVLDANGRWGVESVDKVQQGDWGSAIAGVERVMYMLKGISQLVILIAHTKIALDDGDREYEELGVYGKNLPRTIAKVFDEIWCTKVTGSGASRKFLLQTVSTGTVKCKTRRQLPDGTDMNEGMERLLERMGWRWPEGVAGAAASAGLAPAAPAATSTLAPAAKAANKGVEVKKV